MTTRHTRTSYEKEDLVRCYQGALFGEDGPRLPASPMLMLDRIVEIDAAGGTKGLGRIVAELDIIPNLWFFGCHFLEDPVMPACLVMDGVWQILGFYLAWHGFPGRGRALGAEHARFRAEVLPSTSRVRYEVDVQRIARRVPPVIIGNADVYADEKLAYEMQGMRLTFLPKAEMRAATRNEINAPPLL